MSCSRFRDFAATSSILVAIVSGAALSTSAIRAQESGKTVADGVYTDTQATRGATAYDSACSRCHRADLGGTPNGPSLRDERFANVFAGKDLRTLFSKIATTMPRGAAGSLGEPVYLDIVAHVLKENGFPAGSHELAADALDGVRVLPGKPRAAAPIGDFSYVEAVGCLTPGPQNTWMLTNATEPAAAAPAASTPSTDAATRPLGTQTFHLVDAMAYSPAAHKGHRMYVRGLMIRLPGEQRITISAFEMVSPTCRE